MKSYLLIFFTLLIYALPSQAVECESYLKPTKVVYSEIEVDESIDERISWSQYDEETKDYFYFSGYIDINGDFSFATFLVNHFENTRSSMQGRKYFRKAIRFFGKRNIETILAQWLENSDNHLQYHTALQQGMTPEQAAFSTWTGRQAKSIGFSRIESITFVEDPPRSPKIFVRFKRDYNLYHKIKTKIENLKQGL